MDTKYELILVKKLTQYSWRKLSSAWKQHHWLSNTHIYSQVVFSRASWVSECKALHLVYVCQCWVRKPLNVASAGPLIEPDQFTKTASRLAQLPHQRNSNNYGHYQTWKSHICVCFKASMAALNTLRMQAFTALCQANSLDTGSFWNNLGTEQRLFTNTTTPNCTVIRSLFAVGVETNKNTSKQSNDRL